MEEKLNAKKQQGILPANGIMTVQALADWLGTSASRVQQALSDRGVKIISLGQKYRNRLIRLEDIRP